MTLNVIHCNGLAVIMLGMYKAAAVLSGMKKVYGIPRHDRGHIIVMLVLQSCTDSFHILPGLSVEKYGTPSDSACNSSNIGVEENVDVIEEGFISINKEADIGIKQEEIHEDINFSGIRSEPDDVSSMCAYVCYQSHVTSFRKYQSFCDVIISGQ